MIRLVVVPALDEGELGAAVERRLEPVAVAADRHARVVGREDERRRCARRRRRAPRSAASAIHGCQCFMPDVDGEPELALERGALRLGDLVQRRAPADAPVALDELLDRLRADGPAAADVLEVGGDVLEPRRAPVGHQDDRLSARPSSHFGPASGVSARTTRAHFASIGCESGEARDIPSASKPHAATSTAVRSCTSSTRRPRSAGSVAGRTPWPRLKMCPRRPATASRIRVRRRLDPLPGAEQQRGSRLPCTPRSRPTSLPAAVDRDPPVEPDHVPAGRRHVLEQVRRAGAEVDRRHVDASRMRAE